jgi:curved DNA-binding protein CbpA
MGLERIDYYAILEVARNATQSDIYSAYQKAHQTFSLKNPDLYKVFSPEEAHAWLELVEEAYSVIGSPNSRRQYDIEYEGLFQANLPKASFTDESSEADKLKLKKPEKESLPEGYAETKISQYPISPRMEEAIKNQDVFDGLFLKKIREYKKIELADFSEITCIAIRHLYAIENNNFSVLPAPVFVRGYIIQYCRILSLDESTVVPSFMSFLKNDN